MSLLFAKVIGMLCNYSYYINRKTVFTSRTPLRPYHESPIWSECITIWMGSSIQTRFIAALANVLAYLNFTVKRSPARVLSPVNQASKSFSVEIAVTNSVGLYSLAGITK
jgi:hypothetical protein